MPICCLAGAIHERGRDTQQQIKEGRLRDLDPVCLQSTTRQTSMEKANAGYTSQWETSRHFPQKALICCIAYRSMPRISRYITVVPRMKGDAR